jgi:hypothetical protein
MYSLLGPSECVKSVRSWVRRSGGRGDGDLLALKAEYNALLAGLQGDAACTRSGRPEFVDDPVDEARLLAAFVEAPTENDILAAVTPEVVAATIDARDPDFIALTREATIAAAQRLYDLDSDRGAVFGLIVNRLFCARLAHNLGGSTHRSVGAVWINLPESTPALDRVEFLMHELTHNLLFVDDRAHGHFASAAAFSVREGGATSAIRRTPRPLYCVFHSLLVAVEIFALREQVLGHPEAPVLHPASPRLLADCIATAASIREIPGWREMFTARGRHLFDLCQIFLAEQARSVRADRPPVEVALQAL